MNTKVEAVEKMNVYANELVKMIVKDGKSLQDEKLRIAFENVVRAMVDMTNIQLDKEKDASDTLKTTLSRMKIAHNCMQPNSLVSTKNKNTPFTIK
ncbi:hypothetical protein [Sutcliffiella horikoshii]|uniref:Uncharacterized protein n=1 Tax=Sutcliffiella horikoshii TaxID=79883 RepID=A0A5D4TCN3_9BACI|nr:hypothetical protein [Sutcliffiella horikoshii]TYS73510.1 hypothetical protein FZC75_04045 [Sutcliffiella horikoshii]